MATEREVYLETLWLTGCERYRRAWPYPCVSQGARDDEEKEHLEAGWRHVRSLDTQGLAWGCEQPLWEGHR